VNDSAAHKLEFTRRFRAPREEVFRAFVEPQAVRAWWAPKGWVTPEVEMDLQVGGRYRFGMRAEAGGELMYVHGRYVVIEPPARLVFTYIWEPGGTGERWREHGLIGAETLVTLEFREWGETTEVSLRHEGFPTAEGRDVHQFGWSSNWDCLEEFLLLTDATHHAG
jgi:uncharacterized protein YndB with AHSA1/START domain